MTILWCGGEPEDFEPAIPDFSTNTAYFRSAYSRVALFAKTLHYTTAFHSTCTEVWSSIRYRYYSGSTVYSATLLGFVSGQSTANAIHFYRYGNKYQIKKIEGGSSSTLAESEEITVDGQVYKADFYLNYGVSGLAIIYVGGVEVTRYAGDLTISGLSSFDRGFTTGNQYGSHYISEIIVADTNTRLMSLKTLAPNAAGDTNEWDSGSYTDIDEIDPSDADVISTEGVGDNFQCNLTGMPTGTFKVKAVKVSASSADDAAQMGLKLGVKTNGAVHLGPAHSLTPLWVALEKIFQTNPETASIFTSGEIDSLQLALRTDSTTTTSTTTTSTTV